MKVRSLFFISILFFIQSSHADSLRCGQYSVKGGESTIEVLNMCGEPLLKESLGTVAEEHDLNGTGTRIRVNEEVVTRWTYGKKGELYKYVTFHNGQVRSIQTGGRRKIN
ncbi:DUF2845 domain-containing protein [Zooshikella harenae]|uniref:DUF2845 domain-containing protein n=1 Tax=Zooshikella harenae TaxID=2827238 RepID=A0ABS5ZHG5_9GAMM|nr:DUF2845 domain-containing protein [Zooshikella harenae]MBU2713509.1 DUF2845 domain-containing protein [Zooshikella harenae]